MQSEKILELEVQLLIVKYGYKQVIKALALAQNAPEEDIETKITLLLNKRATVSRPKEVNVLEIADKISIEKPLIASQIKQLAILFENKIFLPQLRDVKRFIEKRLNKHITLKSRLAGAKRVFDIIKELSNQDLADLLESSSTEQSDFSLLSEQIIGNRIR